MRVNEASIRRTAANSFLLLVSCAVGLALCEGFLRLFYPKYRHLAVVQFHTDAGRIWARTPNSRDWRSHPDTHVPYSFYHNNLALRQHRDFSEADLAASTNVGVFGDSFTENFRMPVQYAFTEPLDYLLNQSGKPFNVLNFGVGGYGTDQSLLHYESFHHAEKLDHVLYVYCRNDLQNIYTKSLFRLDEAGRLVRNESVRASWWVLLINKLHVSYLVLDVSGRLSPFITKTAAFRESMRRGAYRQGRPDYSEKNVLETFRQLIRHWKHLAEHNGSTFSVVLLPDEPDPVIVDLLEAEDVAIIDLYACFRDADPAYLWSSYRFQNDGHWSEAGNRLAAICLYRVLEEKTGLSHLSEGRLQEALFQYYAAFGDEVPLKTAGVGGGSPETASAIREKYLALEMSSSLNNLQERTAKLVVQPDRRIIAADFDVYLHRNHLFYVKEDCRQADLEAPFFLHSIEVDNRVFSNYGFPQGFKRRQFKFAGPGLRIGRHGCAFRKMLARAHPSPIRSIRTGQYVPDKGRLWEGGAEIVAGRSGDERSAFPVTTAPRIIAADFDVYLNDRQLVYHKADCGPADRAAPFFLQVTPVDETVLPPDQAHKGFESLDVTSCTTERRLPAYAIRHIRTGQYTSEGELWEAAFTLEQARGGRGDERTAAPQRIVRSVFDVVLEDRRLIYRKAECRPVDQEALFFLHVTPVDETDLPPERVRYRFDNLDFRHQSEFDFRVDEFGCSRTMRLPAYAIRRIRTGQYVPGKGLLWESEFSTAQDAPEQN